jgi:hypothetical protein
MRAFNGEVAIAVDQFYSARKERAALFIALVRKLIDKGVISKEEMSGIVDEAGALLSQGNPIAMRQALQTLRWFRQDIGIEGPTMEG